MIQAELQPGRHNGTKEEASLISTSKLGAVFGVRHLNNITGASSLDKHSAHAQNEATSHQHREICASGL